MKRFKSILYNGKPWLQAVDDGEYVLFEDVRELAEERDMALAERDRLKNENMGLHARLEKLREMDDVEWLKERENRQQ